MPSGRLVVPEFPDAAGAGASSAGGGGVGACARTADAHTHWRHASQKTEKDLKYTPNVEESPQDTTRFETLQDGAGEEDRAGDAYGSALSQGRLQSGADI